MGKSPIKIVQISDSHLLADPSAQLLGVPTGKSFDAVLKLIKDNKEEMDLILLTGDLSQDGSTASYQTLARKLKEFKVPAYWVPGNHDDSNIMNKVYPLENIINDKQIILGSWQLILLDSHC